jgi:predicted  nucleic acid-binding Zn-ribbon protein
VRHEAEISLGLAHDKGKDQIRDLDNMEIEKEELNKTIRDLEKSLNDLKKEHEDLGIKKDKLQSNYD